MEESILVPWSQAWVTTHTARDGFPWGFLLDPKAIFFFYCFQLFRVTGLN